MNKWIAGLAGVLMLGVGIALTVHSVRAGAQDAPLSIQRHEGLDWPVRPLPPEGKVVQLDEGRLWSQAGFPFQSKTSQAERADSALQPFQVLQSQGQAGTWQIVPARDATLLLNSATGATFMLVVKDGDAHWKPVEGNLPARTAARSAIARIEWPGMRRYPVPPEVDPPPGADADVEVLRALLDGIDAMMASLKGRIDRGAAGRIKERLEERIGELRTERKKVAAELEAAMLKKEREEPRTKEEPSRR